MAYGNGFNGYGGYFGAGQGGGMNTVPLYNPYAAQQIPQQNPNVPSATPANNGILWVQGETGAKSYLVAAGNTVLLMDSEHPRFYIKTTGPDGMPQPLRVFDYKEVVATPTQSTSAGVVTREEYEALKTRLDDLVQKFASIEKKGDDE